MVILGILAAIVIPQFTNASEEAKESSLASDLQTMRSQVELFKVHHNGLIPGAGGGTTARVVFVVLLLLLVPRAVQTITYFIPEVLPEIGGPPILKPNIAGPKAVLPTPEFFSFRHDGIPDDYRQIVAWLRDEAKEEGRVLVRGDFDADALEALGRRWTWGSGCGAGGTSRDLDTPAYAPVGPGRPVSPERLRELFEAFAAKATFWRQTGGVHACALAGEDGIVLFAEDIGRHNAFDKIMGAALLGGIDVSDKFVLTTGRISAEIVSKAVACRVPMLASRSAVTSLGVKLARRFGLTLVGFLRGRRMNVYTGYERVAGPAGQPPDDTA
jgi:FdhD protein